MQKTNPWICNEDFLQITYFLRNLTKGLLISKCLFGVLNFLIKTNENKSRRECLKNK